VFDVLSGRKLPVQAKWCYRFPKARTQQLAKARDAIAERSLSERLFEIYDPKILRQQLVKDISGLGPKQASMFLRNIGRSYDLAIIDTHVLRFMNVKNLLCRKNINISTVKAYERAERIVVNYAEELGYPVGYMDWAIWATMRAANEMGI
jgi:N-glycosylase/DNA lyase